MEYIHYLSTIPTSIDDLPDAEERLRSIQRDLTEITNDIVQKKPITVRNTILSVFFAVAWIMGAERVSEDGNSPNNMTHVATILVAVVWVVSSLYHGKHIICPGSFDQRSHIWRLQLEQDLIWRACSEIRDKNMSS